MSEVKCTNLRFNLDKPVQRAAWECLQTMDKTRFKSYSQVIALAIVDYFDRLERLQDDPYLETREREERFVGQIVAAVERAMKDTLPVYLAGCMTGLTQAAPSAPAPMPEASEDAVDWGFSRKVMLKARKAALIQSDIGTTAGLALFADAAFNTN